MPLFSRSQKWSNMSRSGEKANLSALQTRGAIVEEVKRDVVDGSSYELISSDFITRRPQIYANLGED